MKKQKPIKVDKPKQRVPVQVNRKAGPMRSKKDYNRQHSKNWHDWESEYAVELSRIDHLVRNGHTVHCANRMIWGGDECICNMNPDEPCSPTCKHHVTQ